MNALPSFAPRLAPETPLRRAITQATRIAEPEAVLPLLASATLPEADRAAIAKTARQLIEALRAKARHRGNSGGVQALVQEFALSSHEGVALMCLAEALLRIPDDATRDALIRDKLATGNWAAHLGGDKPLFVNAATWGLVITGKLAASVDATGLGHALTRMVHRLGEPVIRRGVDVAMRMMGEQFVMGETIEDALTRARRREAQGFAFSYDMLGEAAATAEDAARYFESYTAAIHAIGKASAGRGIVSGPGISIKLSALHPRYARAQAHRVMAELAPRVLALAELAKSYDIGFNIDAEETDRLELSLDILEGLAHADSLAGWNGLGFVIQAYQKRCPMVIDWIVDLARRSSRRIMVRLVKGAYWDAEIKRAQEAGLDDFPVYTRKVHTDLAYVACAQKLLAARDAVFPQFATHNAQTLASVLHLAGPDFTPGDYEFQCLHGMGEPLYEEVVGPEGLARPCRVYAPVGTHETLLAYLVRRLLENGANSSFVNRIADPDVPVEALIEDPAAVVAAEPEPGAPHAAIALPQALFEARANAKGLDLADEPTLNALAEALIASAAQDHRAGDPARPAQVVLNPADHRDVVGHVHPASPEDAARAAAQAAASGWSINPAATRAAALERAADAMEATRIPLIALLIREAGKSAANALAEVREAVDFLRYYAAEARRLPAEAQSLGPVVCISPWNFPLAIFTGQIAAALAAGNPVLAKPAPETPLIAAEAVRLLHAAGIPADALHFLPGGGEIGAALVAAPETQGVVFTGSTATARAIQQSLAGRLTAHGAPIPFIAETGGLNAMVVDSSALAEQVVADVLASAFDSAGQRCSALRLLCLQEDIADRTLTMLKAAMAELAVGNPAALATDVGPVISQRARTGIAAHVAAMRAAGFPVTEMPLAPETAEGTFIAPTLIELAGPHDLKAEVFGPVLHVVRFRAEDMDNLIEAINASGFGLTFGLHTRIDQTVERVTSRIHAGNLYVNRNMIGAVVGVQPFGGHGLSGTGPKAGGPLYLTRFAPGAVPSLPAGERPAEPDAALAAFALWASAQGLAAAASAAWDAAKASLLGFTAELPGPVGERNAYRLAPRGRIACSAASVEALWQQVAAVLATGNTAVITVPSPIATRPAGFPAALAARVLWDEADLSQIPDLAAMLVEGPAARIAEASRQLAQREGAIVPLHISAPGGTPLHLLLEEVTLSVNTTAAGGNASLMALA
jgi:RHH-type proline utilization regulon transcriptional repressor/proline dehydrogenase/delta 1-pyrroline-5-carboxylate dehydrogenase